jgi:hypothetical protein
MRRSGRSFGDVTARELRLVKNTLVRRHHTSPISIHPAYHSTVGGVVARLPAIAQQTPKTAARPYKQAKRPLFAAGFQHNCAEYTRTQEH